jgi:hypothetical protein
MFRFSILDNPVLAVSKHEQTWAKLEDLKIQDVLKQEEGLKGIKGLRLNKIKQEVEVAKTR